MRKLLNVLMGSTLLISSMAVLADSSTVDAVLPTPKMIQPFNLQGTQGQPFTQESLKGHWTFMFFGFTRCASICPTSMAALNQMYKKLQQDKVQSLPQVVFVSVDPERDDKKQVNQYVKTFNKNFVGATGSAEQVSQLTTQLGIMFMKVNQDTKMKKNYQIDHSGSILLTDPKGELYAIFTMPHDSAKIANDFEQILKNYHE